MRRVKWGLAEGFAAYAKKAGPFVFEVSTRAAGQGVIATIASDTVGDAVDAD